VAINLHKIFSQIPFTNWERLSVIRVVFLHKHIFYFYVLLLLLNVGDLSILESLDTVPLWICVASSLCPNVCSELLSRMLCSERPLESTITIPWNIPETGQVVFISYWFSVELYQQEKGGGMCNIELAYFSILL
jgi:hypothetical protein